MRQAGGIISAYHSSFVSQIRLVAMSSPPYPVNSDPTVIIWGFSYSSVVSPCCVRAAIAMSPSAA